jgi:septum formation protein
VGGISHLAHWQPLLLASRSPQRRAILQQLGVRFSVLVPETEELLEGEPEEAASENARRKALAIARVHRDAPVLGVDTVVCIDRRIYGKPRDPEQARETLSALSGRTHAVISGLCLLGPEDSHTTAVTTLVEFRALDERLVEWYVATGEWRDRAGGYAIQGRGAALVKAIEGDYFNVVGLPVARLLDIAPWLLGD